MSEKVKSIDNLKIRVMLLFNFCDIFSRKIDVFSQMKITTCFIFATSLYLVKKHIIFSILNG